MQIPDMLKFNVKACKGYPLRTMLMLLAMAIGVSSVVVLSTLGEGARLYVTGEFASLGSHLLIVLPGRSETVGGAPPLIGETVRDLTLADALALRKSTAVRKVAPMSVGAAPVSWNGREREVPILGSTPDFFDIRDMAIATGRLLPDGSPFQGSGVCVLGYRLKEEIFGNVSPLGEWIRIGESRFRVVGVMAKKGQSLGFDMGDVAVIPVASALRLFNKASLFRVLVQADGRESIPKAKEDILEIIQMRHEGEDDITVVTQDAVLSAFDKIFKALTMTVAGIAAISLSVAGILIMNVMLIAVSQRNAEIGLLKAIGATGRQIMAIFLSEAAGLSLLGAMAGVLLSLLGVWFFGRMFPAFPMSIPLWALTAAVMISLATGMIFGVLPARMASRLDPVAALSKR
jgi:putative ABC transport system permease protein